MHDAPLKAISMC